MKITIFGLTLSSSWGNGHATPYRAILRALSRMGHLVTFYERDVAYYASRRDFDHCDYCELVLYANWEQVRTRALADAATSDVVITASYVPDGARISDEILQLHGPVHVFYDLDTPITLANLTKGDLEYLRRDQIPAFDLYLSFTGGRTLEELETRWGAQLPRALYGCVDPEVHKRVPERNDFRCAMSYMGTYAEDRQQKLESLFLTPARSRESETFVLAGSLYPWQWQWPGNVKRFEHVAPADHPALYSSSRLTLNITRDGMGRGGHCPSGRFFEAAACAAPIVTDWFDGLDEFFEPGEEIFVVSKPEEVIAALDSTDDQLHRMARMAGERTLTEHTGDRRARQLLQFIEEARSRSGTALHGDKASDLEAVS